MVVPLFIKIDVSVPAGENGFADAASQSRPALDGVDHKAGISYLPDCRIVQTPFPSAHGLETGAGQ
jgi:hypothetical protein